MKLPTRNTFAMAVCKSIYLDGTDTPDAIAADLEAGYGNARVKAKVHEMITTGQILMVHGKLSLSIPVLRHMEDIDPALADKGPPAPVVLPAPARPFKPLVGYKLPIDGMREGAADHRKWKSKHL